MTSFICTDASLLWTEVNPVELLYEGPQSSSIVRLPKGVWLAKKSRYLGVWRRRWMVILDSPCGGGQLLSYRTYMDFTPSERLYIWPGCRLTVWERPVRNICGGRSSETLRTIEVAAYPRTVQFHCYDVRDFDKFWNRLVRVCAPKCQNCGGHLMLYSSFASMIRDTQRPHPHPHPQQHHQHHQHQQHVSRSMAWARRRKHASGTPASSGVSVGLSPLLTHRGSSPQLRFSFASSHSHSHSQDDSRGDRRSLASYSHTLQQHHRRQVAKVLTTAHPPSLTRHSSASAARERDRQHTAAITNTTTATTGSSAGSSSIPLSRSDPSLRNHLVLPMPHLHPHRHTPGSSSWRLPGQTSRTPAMRLRTSLAAQGHGHVHAANTQQQRQQERSDGPAVHHSSSHPDLCLRLSQDPSFFSPAEGICVGGGPRPVVPRLMSIPPASRSVASAPLGSPDGLGGGSNASLSERGSLAPLTLEHEESNSSAGGFSPIRTTSQKAKRKSSAGNHTELQAISLEKIDESHHEHLADHGSRTPQQQQQQHRSRTLSQATSVYLTPLSHSQTASGEAGDEHDGGSGSGGGGAGRLLFHQINRLVGVVEPPPPPPFSENHQTDSQR
ncbi:unnamed protein product [Vitrella brassicaformis CCMP3155]|uniref:PH domain-containing protein n=2 Tax=Vitrella brassicaformis TaxID=1169539 RepID=A0A0G4E973_VITBC|nr:unnamed protein product [Vitrella brassicaformis CCMP3155]|eukprot:CEL91782.1 unnamed protein product [Vitrella brassicaformis CCMP3155]